MRPDEYGPREPSVSQDEHVRRDDGLVHVVCIPALGGLIWHAWCDEGWGNGKRTTSPDKVGDAPVTCLRCLVVLTAYRRRYR